jgi:general secretion pathway protein D
MPSPHLPQRLIPLLSTLLTTASLSAQEPTAAATRPSPEQRLSTVQAETNLPSPAPTPIDFRSPVEPTRPLPEMRLLAQATPPTPSPSAAGSDTPTAPATPSTPGNAPADTTTPPPSGPSAPGGGFGPGGDRPRFGGPRGGGFGPGGGMSPVVGQDGIETMVVDGDKVKLQFPNNPVEDLLNIYERLTSMTLVKDTGIFEGATISLVTPIPVEKSEAIRLIEAALLTNGYAIVIDPGGTSARVLPARTQGATAVQFSHGVTLYQSAADIPQSETLVSYFMALDNLVPEDAATILANHVGLSIYGRMTPVTTPPGLLITESATIVRQLISIKDAIDSPSTASDLITKFIPLEHADATVVAQIVQATVTAQAQEQETKGITTLRGTPGSDGKSDNKDGKENKSSPTPGGVQQLNGKSAEVASITAQVVADARLNQVLVVAAPEDYTYIASLIAQFDQPLELEQPYERPLKYASAVDILSALVDVLQESTGGTTQLPGGGSLTAQRGQALTSSSAQLLGGNRATNSRGGQTTATGGATDDLGTGSATGIGSRPDLISGPTEDNAPVSVIVDKTRIVADPMANAILVMGRKENIEKIDGLIDKLDRKPAQVYLSTVIGQLTLGEGMETGVDYLTRFNSTRGDAGGTGSLFTRRDDIISNNNITDLRDNLITSAFGPATGLNLYGSFGDSVDVFVNALETSNRFKVLSRPAVFALNNKKATITSGQLIPVPAQSTTFVGNGANASNVTTTIEYRDVVLKLEVVPLINADGEVNLTIAQINDTVIGSQRVEPNDIPIIGTEQIVTSVTVPDGKTIVLGGLISEEKKNDRQGMPYISRLPLLGKLFRQDIDSDKRRELIIFIQPQVVTDNMSLFKASNQEDRRTDIGAEAAIRFPQDLPQEYATPQVTVDDTRKGFFSRLFRRPSKKAPSPLQ